MLTKDQLLEMIQSKKDLHTKKKKELEIELLKPLNKRSCIVSMMEFSYDIEIKMLEEIFHDYYEHQHLNEKSRIQRRITILKNKLNKIPSYADESFNIRNQIGDLEEILNNISE